MRSLKRWHWIALGAIIGVLIAVARLIAASDQRIGGRGFISQAEFERSLRLPPLMGRPYLRAVVVHPLPDVDVVTLEELVPETLVYQAHRFAAPKPYQPIGEDLPPSREYSVQDYLRDFSAGHPDFTYRYAWWDEPRSLCVLLAAAGALIIGGLWPSLLRLGAQQGSDHQDYNLDRFHTDPALPDRKPPAEPDQQLLERLEAQQQVLGLDATPALEGPAAARVTPLTSAAIPSAPEPAEEDKQYVGEFYPVETRTPHGFSLSELVVVLGIIALLFSLLLPALRLARLQAQTVQCATQLRQLGQGLSMYAQQNRGWLPAWSGWHTWPPGTSDDSTGPAWTIEMIPYLGTPDSPIYHCPSFPGPVPCRNYFLAAQWAGQSHQQAMKLSDVTMTSRFVLSGDKTQLGLYPPPDGTSEHLMDDADPDDHGTGMPVLAWPWEQGGFYMHRGGNNILFDDMHVGLFGRYERDAMTFNPHRMQNWADVTPD